MSNNTFIQASLNKSSKDKFRLIFEIPPALKTIDKKLTVNTRNIDRDTLQFSVWGSIIPEIVVPATEIRYAGNTLYNSSHSRDSYPPNTVNFNVDNEFKNYWVIYRWLNLLHDQQDGYFDAKEIAEDETYLQYMTNMEIQALDEYNNPTFKWVFTKSFPTVLGQIDYNNKDDGEIECQFTFVYSQIHAGPATTQ